MSKLDFPPPDKTPPTAMEIVLGAAEENKRIVKEEKERSFGEDIGAELFSSLREAIVKNPASDPTDANPSGQGKVAKSDEKILQNMAGRQNMADRSIEMLGYFTSDEFSKIDDIRPHKKSLNAPPLEVAEAESEGTKSEWQKKLSGLIESAKGKLYSAKEGVKNYASSSEHLIRRSQELDTQAEKIGGVEKMFRLLGEKYNKMGWKSKLALGASFGLGGALSAASLSLPAMLTFVGLVGAQRTAGLMSMYLKFEKASLPQGEKRGEKFLQWGSKEKAMAKAILYTAGMSVGMGYAIKEISETDIAHRTQEWLGDTFSKIYGALSGGTDAAPSPVPHAITPEVAQPAATVAETPVPASAPTPEPAPAPSVSVFRPSVPEASHVSPVEAPATPAHEIAEKVVKKVVKKASKASVASAKVAYDHMGMQKDLTELKFTPKPEGVPDVAPEAPLPAVEASADSVIPAEQGTGVGDDVRQRALAWANAQNNEVPVAPDAVVTTEAPAPVTPVENIGQTPAPAPEAPVVSSIESSATAPEIASPDITSASSVSPEITPPALEVVAPPQTIPVVEPPEYKGTLPLGNDSIDSSVPGSAQNVHFEVNTYGLPIDVARANIYLDAGGNYTVFGGSPEDCAQKAIELVAEDHSAIVYYGSTEPGGFSNLFRPIYHINKVSWFDGAGSSVDPAQPVGVEVHQPIIVNEAIDKTLQGRRLPSINDLKEVYKPKP